MVWGIGFIMELAADVLRCDSVLFGLRSHLPFIRILFYMFALHILGGFCYIFLHSLFVNTFARIEMLA